MLQTDDKDRWPLWDTRYGADEDVTGENEPGATAPTGRKETDKKIAANERTKPTSSNYSLQDALRFASLGTELFAAVILGTLLGWALSWLVGKLTGHEPTWLIAVGVFLGAIAGFLNLYRVIVEEEKKEEQQKRGSSK